MIDRFLRGGVGALLVAGVAMIARAATVPVVVQDPVQAVTSIEEPAAMHVRSSVADSLTTIALRRPLFRSDRRPAAVPYDPQRSAAPAEPAAPVERPTLALSGIVWGAEPAALIEGMPGVEGSLVLRRGEASAGIRIVRIERTRVVLSGRDTTWILQVREPWK
jgi:hypothetical protein